MRVVDLEQIAEIVAEKLKPVLQSHSGTLPRYLRVRTAARLYDFGLRELRQMCLLGKIEGATRAGGKEWRIPVESMERMMKEES